MTTPNKIPAALLIPIALAAGYLPLLQWWCIFDPDLINMPWDSPQWALYWRVKHSFLYALLFSLFWASARYAGFGRPYIRFAYVLLQWWMLFAFIDLQCAGNWLTGTYWDWVDWVLFGLGSIAAVLTEWKFRIQVGDPLEAKTVYLVTRPPRNWIEWAGSVISGNFGPLGYFYKVDYKGGFWHGPKGKFKIRYKKLADLPPDCVLKKTGFDRDRFAEAWMRIHGKKWTYRKNCFWMRREVNRRIKELTRNE